MVIVHSSFHLFFEKLNTKNETSQRSGRGIAVEVWIEMLQWHLIFFVFFTSTKVEAVFARSRNDFIAQKKSFYENIFQWKTVSSFLLTEPAWIASRSQIGTKIEPNCDIQLWIVRLDQTNLLQRFLPIHMLRNSRATLFCPVVAFLELHLALLINQSTRGSGTSRPIHSFIQAFVNFNFRACAFHAQSKL